MHGVAIEAAVLPAGWQRRAIAVRSANMRNPTGWCVEAHDLAASQLAEFRETDREFVRTLIADELVSTTLGPAASCASFTPAEGSPACATSLVRAAFVGSTR